MQENSANPKVSVCVITYNQERYLHKCLQSIVEQETDFDFEVIVGDDCSTDGTPLILREFAERYPDLIKPIYNKENLGYFKNYVEVHLKAQGIYVAHCDGDDFWYPGKLKHQVAFLDMNPKVAAVCSNARTGGGIKYNVKECGFISCEQILERVYTHSLCVHSSILERSACINPTFLEEAAQFNFEIYEFEWFWLKHRNSLFYIDPVIRVNYELSSNGLSRQREFTRKLQPSLFRLKQFGMNEKTLEKMHFDYKIAAYCSDPFNNNRPSIRTALRFHYGYGIIGRLIAPARLYYAIKLIKHPELKPQFV